MTAGIFHPQADKGFAEYCAYPLALAIIQLSGAVESGVRYFSAATCLHRPEVYGGIGESEAAALLRSFFALRR